MSHTVEIDQTAQYQQQARIAALLPPPEQFAELPGMPGEGADYGDKPNPETVAEFRAAIEFFFPIIHGAVCPNWEISGQGRDVMFEGLAEQLALLFPDGVIDPDKLPPWLKCVFGAGLVAMANFDMQSGRFRPLKLPEPVKDQEGGENDGQD